MNTISACQSSEQYSNKLYQSAFLTLRIYKVKWITANNCGKPKWHSFTPSLSWKREILGLDIVSQNVPKKTYYWTKMGDLGIIFLRRSCLIHWLFWYQLLQPHIVGSTFVCRSVFFFFGGGGHPVYFPCINGFPKEHAALVISFYKRNLFWTCISRLHKVM